LQKYFQCSLKWLFERVLSLENIEIETSLMAGNISGLVYHAVLNIFFTELKNKNLLLVESEQDDYSPSLQEPYNKLLEHSINEVFDNFPALKPNGSSQMSALTARLLRAGKKDYHYILSKSLSHFLSLFSGCTVVGSESYYRLEKESFFLAGAVDCILKKNDKYIIVDFKLKKIPKRSDCIAEEGNDLADFQLPMYITLAEENENIKVYTALFYSLVDSKEERFEREWYDSVFEEFKSKTEQFAQEISTGDFTVFPQNNNDCTGCDYQSICRTVYIVGRD
jgi:CRISPR/Cas system-associated exonuclease Cas4 (RecB family)